MINLITVSICLEKNLCTLDMLRVFSWASLRAQETWLGSNLMGQKISLYAKK